MFRDGNVYKGCWKKDLMHGYGVMQYVSGHRYEGHWMGNKKHGKGKFIYRDGNW